MLIQMWGLPLATTQLFSFESSIQAIQGPRKVVDGPGNITNTLNSCWRTTLLRRYGIKCSNPKNMGGVDPQYRARRQKNGPKLNLLRLHVPLQCKVYVFKLQSFKNEFTKDALRPKPLAKALLRYPNVATICCCHQRCGLPAQCRDICSSLTLLRRSPLLKPGGWKPSLVFDQTSFQFCTAMGILELTCLSFHGSKSLFVVFDYKG